MPRKRWLILVMVFFAPFTYLFALQSAPPLLPTITEHFQLTHAEASLVMLLVALPAMLLSIPAGFLVDRYGNKRVGAIGLLVVFSGALFTALAPSFTTLLVGRTLVGIGSALVFTAVPPLLFQWFSGRELGLAMGIWAFNMPLATVLAFNTLGRVEMAYGLKAAFDIPAVIGLIMLILFPLLVEEKRDARHRAFSVGALKKGNIWLLGFIWGAINVAVIGLTTWGSTIFTQFKGIPPIQADFLAGLIMLLLFTTPLAGYLSGRLGVRRPLILISTLGMVVMLALIPGVNGMALVATLVVLGLFVALAPPAIFSLPPVLVGQENVGVGFGVLNTGVNMGIVVGPLIVGASLDLVHSQQVPFLIMSFFSLVAAFLTYLLKAK